jgi:ATP-dependent Lhr-like helicase
VLAAVGRDEITITASEADTPSPRAFGLATLMASDVVLAEDESRVLREFHDRVLDEIGEGEHVDVGADVDADD